MINVSNFQLFCMLKVFIGKFWGNSWSISQHWATWGLWAWSPVQWLHPARMMCNVVFLYPCKLAAPFVFPRVGRQGPGLLLPYLGHSCHQMLGSPSAASQSAASPFSFLSALGLPSFSSAPSHGTTWFNSVVLEPGEEKQGDKIMLSQYAGGDSEQN